MNIIRHDFYFPMCHIIFPLCWFSHSGTKWIKVCVRKHFMALIFRIKLSSRCFISIHTATINVCDPSFYLPDLFSSVLLDNLLNDLWCHSLYFPQEHTWALDLHASGLSGEVTTGVSVVEWRCVRQKRREPVTGVLLSQLPLWVKWSLNPLGKFWEPV